MSGGRLAATGVTLLVLAAGVLAGCGDEEAPGPQLRALEADPLARYVPPGGKLVRTNASGQRDDGLLRKATPATLRRYFSVPAGKEDAALADAARTARDAGWTLAKPVSGLGTTGRKRLPSGEATVSLSVATTAAGLPESTTPPVLAVALEHSR